VIIVRVVLALPILLGLGESFTDGLTAHTDPLPVSPVAW